MRQTIGRQEPTEICRYQCSRALLVAGRKINEIMHGELTRPIVTQSQQSRTYEYEW